MFQNLKLRTKLVVIAAPPLLVLAMIAAYSVLLSRGAATSVTELSGDIRTLGMVALATLLLSALTVLVIGRTITDPIEDISLAARELAENRLPLLLETLQNPGAEAPTFEPLTGGKNDEMAALVAALNSVQEGVADVAVQQRAIVREGLSDLVVNLARRNQSLLDRQIELIDQLEAAEQDPDRLEDLFGLDHLATRMRRNAESLLVVAGAEPARRRGGPVAIADVLRVAMSEIEDYRHVNLASVEEAFIGSQGAVDLAHLFSELLENATQFSPPDSPVDVNGNLHPDGSYLISCVDHGIGMTAEQLAAANNVLQNPPELGFSLTRSLGFIVVGRLARRLGVAVELTHTAAGGITAIAEVPATVLAGGAPLGSAPAAIGGSPAPTEAAAVTPPQPPQAPAPVQERPAAAVPQAAAAFGLPADEPAGWTPPAAPERGANPIGASAEPLAAIPEAPAFPDAPAASVPAMPSEAAVPVPEDPSPPPVAPPVAEPAAPVSGLPEGAPQSEALAKLLGLGPSLDEPTEAPTPTVPSESSSMIFGRPVDEERPAPAPDVPWSAPVFDPNALEISHEPVREDDQPEKLEDAIPTGENFEEGVGSLLESDDDRTSDDRTSDDRTSDDRTSTGLVKRDRKKNMAPASEGRPVTASVRSPDEIRSMLSRYRSGLKGKPLADLATPPMPEAGAPDPVSYDSFSAGPGDAEPFNGDETFNPNVVGDDDLGDAFQNDFDNNGESQ